MTDRRDFLKHGSLAAAALWTGACASGAPPIARAPAPAQTPPTTPPADLKIPARELMMRALDAARDAGADYADVRIGRYRNNFIVTREQQIINVVDTDSIGCGVRALVDGTWGFGATRTLTADAVAAAAREAVAIAKASRIARDRPVRSEEHTSEL